MTAPWYGMEVWMDINAAQKVTNENMDKPLPPLRVDELLYYATLLAGLGPQARRVADELRIPLTGQMDEGRTCIDAGSPLMFSLLAPGGRGLRVLTRTRRAENGVATWVRNYYPDDPLSGPLAGRIERWHSETYQGEPDIAWTHAQAAAEFAGGLDSLRQAHALLGPHSRLYSVNWTLSSATQQASVGWQLDRSLPADVALAAIGCGDAWLNAATLWADLLGRQPHPGRGPWSISLFLGGELRWRLGSSNWARCMEDAEKRRRLAVLVEQRGGDRRFAEALYRLVASSAQVGRPHAVGRAVEVELVDGRPELAEFYICLP